MLFIFALNLIKYIYELHSPSTVHSQNQYYETIFQEWKTLYKNIPASIIHEHPHMIKQEWITHTGNTCYIGYFQRYEYMDLIRDEFISKLKFQSLYSHTYFYNNQVSHILLYLELISNREYAKQNWLVCFLINHQSIFCFLLVASRKQHLYNFWFLNWL